MSIQLDAIESNAIQPDESVQRTGDAQPGALPAQNTSQTEQQSNACPSFSALRQRIPIIFKFVSALAITVISFIAIPAWLETRRATRIAEWTAEKDYIEYCIRLVEKHQPLTDSCVTALKQKLAPPPGFSDYSRVMPLNASKGRMEGVFESWAEEYPGLRSGRSTILDDLQPELPSRALALAGRAHLLEENLWFQLLITGILLFMLGSIMTQRTAGRTVSGFLIAGIVVVILASKTSI